MREIILWITIVLLFGIASAEFGFIIGKREKFDYKGNLVQHETKIQILQSEIRLVKNKLRIP